MLLLKMSQLKIIETCDLSCQSNKMSALNSSPVKTLIWSLWLVALVQDHIYLGNWSPAKLSLWLWPWSLLFTVTLLHGVIPPVYGRGQGSVGRKVHREWGSLWWMEWWWWSWLIWTSFSGCCPCKGHPWGVNVWQLEVSQWLLWSPFV